MRLIVGTLEDTRDCPVTVIRERGDIRVEVKSPGPWYKNPSPHMNADQAKALAAILKEALGPDVGDVEGPLEEETTPRGFKIFGDSIIDLDGNKVRVQESSAAGDPCCYLFTTGPDGIREEELDPTPRFTPEMVRELILRLLAFAADAESPDNWHNTPEYIAAWRSDG